jgi:hypothetical protein
MESFLSRKEKREKKRKEQGVLFFVVVVVGIRSASTPSVTRRGLGLSSMGQRECKHTHRCV